MDFINEGGQLASYQATWGPERETDPRSDIPRTGLSVLITTPERLGAHHRLPAELIRFFFFFIRSDIAAPRDKTDSVH